MRYKIDVQKLQWQSPMQGMRQKCVIYENKQLRLVEYHKNMPLHWCNKGHIGFVLAGEMEITFTNEKIRYKRGDGVFIPDGDEHKHQGRVITEKVVMIFVEEVTATK